MKDAVETTLGYYDADACDLNHFAAIIDQTTNADRVPHAMSLDQNVPIYDMSALRPMLDMGDRRTLMAEWAAVLLSGAGVVVLKNTYPDPQVLDQATAIFDDIIVREKAGAGGGADHFAASGANDRIWNSLQKLCEAAPEVFFDYFANATIAAVCEGWLGPHYQMTAQVNLVHPGGAAQQAHRDYHLGFQTAEISASFPAHVHDVSPILTLQGAVAHCDMPIHSGPTKLLPFSQTYRAGYAAWRRPDFRTLFEERYVQLPLDKGDTVFFNPALFHAAGENTSSDIHRMANLLQISSAFGRAMETVDRDKMCGLVYPVAQRALSENRVGQSDLVAAIGATAEGYSFPTNLDLDPPAQGLAPETQAAFFQRALREKMSSEAFSEHLNTMAAARRA